MSDSNSFRERLDRHQLVTLRPQPGLCAPPRSRPSVLQRPFPDASCVDRSKVTLLRCLDSSSGSVS